MQLICASQCLRLASVRMQRAGLCSGAMQPLLQVVLTKQNPHTPKKFGDLLLYVVYV